MKGSAPPRRHYQLLSRLGMRLNFACVQKVWPGGRLWFPWEQRRGVVLIRGGAWSFAVAKRGVATSLTMKLKGPSTIVQWSAGRGFSPPAFSRSGSTRSSSRRSCMCSAMKWIGFHFAYYIPQVPRLCQSSDHMMTFQITIKCFIQ